MESRDHVTPFTSILYAELGPNGSVERGEPAYFGDLNLDQVLGSMLSEGEQAELAPFFYEPLHDAQAVGYRHEILRDLEREDISRGVAAFTARMAELRKLLGRVAKLRHVHQRERCVPVGRRGLLRGGEVARGGSSRGRRTVLGFARVPRVHRGVQPLTSVRPRRRRRRRVAPRSRGGRYAIALEGMRVTVTPYEPAPDLTAEIEATFAKFREGAVEGLPRRVPRAPGGQPHRGSHPRLRRGPASGCLWAGARLLRRASGFRGCDDRAL